MAMITATIVGNEKSMAPPELHTYCSAAGAD
jgi:hypothetical protein